MCAKEEGIGHFLTEMRIVGTQKSMEQRRGFGIRRKHKV